MRLFYIALLSFILAVPAYGKELALTYDPSTGKTKATKMFARVFDVTVYGADSTGVADSTTAIQAAITAMETAGGGTVYFPAGTYLVSDTLYLDSTNAEITYHIEGDGLGSVIKPSKASDFYIFKLNQDSGGNKVLSYPDHVRCFISDIAINGSACVGAPSLLYYNEASAHLQNINCLGLKYAINGIGYTDNIMVDNLFWDTPVIGGYAVYIGGNGDGVYLRNLFNTSDDMVYILKSAGVTIEACIGGAYVFDKCTNVTVQNCHFEYAGATQSITIIGSQILLENNFINLNQTNEPILLDIDAETNTSFDVTMRNNIFSLMVIAYNTAMQEAFDIASDVTSRSRVRLENNYTYVYGYGRWIFDKIGITATSGDAGLAALFDDNKHMLSNNVLLYYTGSAWVLEGIKADGTPHNNTLSGTTLIANPSIYYIGESAALSGSIVSGSTYYYKTAVYQDGLSTQGSAEVSETTTLNDMSIQLNIIGEPDSYTRIWRGTASGTYTAYVDIPSIGGSVEYYDTGYGIMGTAWDTTGVPSVPSSNTTKFKLHPAGVIQADYLGINTSTVPHNSIGYGLLAIDGGIYGASDAPIMNFTTSADDYPLFTILPYGHDEMYLLFDCYWYSGFKSSDFGSNFVIGKNADKVKIYSSSSNTVSNGMAVTEILSVDVTGNVFTDAYYTFKTNVLSTGVANAGVTSIESPVTVLSSTQLAYGMVQKSLDSPIDQAGTLANGKIGQMVTVQLLLKGGAGNWVVTPTTKTGFNTLTFDTALDSVTLLWISDYHGWIIVGNNGVTIA